MWNAEQIKGLKEVGFTLEQIKGMYEAGFTIEKIKEVYVSGWRAAKFTKILELEDDLSLILRCHLYIEHELEKFIEKYFENPSVLKIKDKFFPQKLDLVVAIGILSREEAAPYRDLNKIRKNFAHEINYKLTEEDFKMIYNGFTRKQKKLYENTTLKMDSLLDKTKKCLLMLWMDLLVRNQEFEKFLKEHCHEKLARIEQKKNDL